MRAHKKKRLKNSIAYMARIHEHYTGRKTAQTYIYTYLALVDFKAIEEIGKPVFDLDYVALRNGPVPIELYDYRDEIVNDESFFDVIRLYSDLDGNYWFECKSEPNLDYLSEYELDLIEKTVEEFGSKGKLLRTEDVIDVAHCRIEAW